MHRREFLRKGGAFTFGLSWLSACTHRDTASPPARHRLRPEFITELENKIPQWMQESKVPGLSIVVIRDAKIAWGRGFGVKDVESNEPVDDNTLFEAA
jgi:CubicO group peptidase (beta-lactamase class C family)